MLTGGQVRSLSPSGVDGGAPWAGSSDFPPKRLLKRSPSDCEDAGEANMLQLTANETAANIAILRRQLDRAALMTRSSPIDVPATLPYLPRTRYTTPISPTPP